MEGYSCLLSSGPPDSPLRYRTGPVAVQCAISFHIRRIRPLSRRSRWHTRHCPVHTGQSGGPNRPLAQLRVARKFRCRPLAASTVGSLDSPVNYSHVAFLFSRERRVHRWRLTRQSGAPSDSPVIYSRVTPSFPESSRFTVGSSGESRLEGGWIGRIWKL
jgi:hypothetical protein